MSNEPKWITADEVILLNQHLLDGTPEPHHVRDQGLVEAGVNRPIHRFNYGETDIITLAAQLMYGVAKAHGFGQGNKRAGWAAGRLFLHRNGVILLIPPGEDMSIAQFVEASMEHEPCLGCLILALKSVAQLRA